MQKDFLDWAYCGAMVAVRANEQLKVCWTGGLPGGFSHPLYGCRPPGREDELQALEKAYETKLERLDQKINQEERELREDRSELSAQAGSTAPRRNPARSVWRRKRRLSSSLTKRRMTSKAKSDVEESQDTIEEYKKQLAEIEQELAQAQEEVNRKWSEIVDDVAEIKVSRSRKMCWWRFLA
jgi:chromosome segregation ATPase